MRPLHLAHSPARLSRALLVSLLVLAAPASAGAAVWKLNGVEVTKATAVTSLIFLLEGKIFEASFKDTPAGLAVTCTPAPGEVDVGPGSAGEIVKLTYSECKFKEASSCESTKPVTVRALNLPWVTELVSKSSEHINGHLGGGTPGFSIECSIFKVAKIVDECTKPETISGSMGSIEGGMSFIIGGKNFQCTVGGAGEDSLGIVEKLDNPGGLVLTIG